MVHLKVFGIKAKIWELATPEADPIKHFLQTFWRQTAQCAHWSDALRDCSPETPGKYVTGFQMFCRKKQTLLFLSNLKHPKNGMRLNKSLPHNL